MKTQQKCKTLYPHSAHIWYEVFERDDLGMMVYVEHFLCTGVLLNAEAAQAPADTVNKRAAILQEAAKLINGDRADTYGPPEVSFGRIGDLWTAMGMQMADAEYSTGFRPVNAVDVALALVQLKVSRIIGQPDHEDSWTDAAGYIGLGAEMATKQNVN